LVTIFLTEKAVALLATAMRSTRIEIPYPV
jgi:hypothetical protein